MKKIAIVLLVCFLAMAFSGVALASVVPVPVVAHHHHPSFWMKYGRFAVGLGLFAKTAIAPQVLLPPRSHRKCCQEIVPCIMSMVTTYQKDRLRCRTSVLTYRKP